jgi:hypothetical protein
LGILTASPAGLFGVPQARQPLQTVSTAVSEYKRHSTLPKIVQNLATFSRRDPMSEIPHQPEEQPTPSTQGDRETYVVDATAAANAMLEMTSDDPAMTGLSGVPYITSKDSYLIAGVAAAIAIMQRQHNQDPVSDLQIKAKIYTTATKFIKQIKESYSELPNLTFDVNPNTNADTRNYWANFLMVAVAEELVFMEAVSDDQDYTEDNWKEAFRNLVNNSIDEGYRILRSEGFISDPILEAGIGMVILSLAPFSITKRTKRGNAAYLEMRAAMWSYQKKRSEDGDTEVNVKFEAMRIARAIKGALTAAFHDATKDEGEEP